MRIKSLEVDGFRCLVNFKISFEDDLTVIVGENDSGKTSLIECLKVITQNKQIESDDFSHDKNEIHLAVEIDDFIFEKSYKNDSGVVSEKSFIAKPTKEYIARIKGILGQDDFNYDDEDNIDLVKFTAKTFGIMVRSNSKIENLIAGILDKITPENGDEVSIENASFPQFNNIQLTGRQFENVSSFFKEVFLKEKQASIWHEKINEETTIEEFIKSRISDYSDEITEKIGEKGILEKMQIFLKDLTDIKIEPQYQSRDLNIDAKVKFLENGKEINLEKKGDGTKRRITMALLEFKKEESLLSNDDSTFYLLDEPDTHLHVKSQLDLLETMKSFSMDGNQVILTTHSPFIINALSPKQIRLLENTKNKSKVRYLKDNKDSSNHILKALGVENTYLFFSRHIVIVEGETEEEFIPSYYLKKHGKPITSDLIKVINTRGITNISGFSKAILEIHNPENIYLVVDNDASPEIEELIGELNIPNEQKFIIGDKEFEDAFQSNVLHKCWCSYLEECNKDAPENWTVDNIETIRNECAQNGEKFSKKIRQLNSGGKKMTKPILGKVLGENIDEAELPERFSALLETIN